MNLPPIKYLVSSPHGDLAIDNDKLDYPLEADPLKTPYRVYFDSINDFISSNALDPLLRTMEEKDGKDTHLNEIREIIVRAEKHGALYHPASVELILREHRVKFGLNVAVTEDGRNWLNKEFTAIQNINAKCKLPYLPEVYFFDERETVSFLLEEWFEGFHEFHLSIGEGGERLSKLWEFGKGYKNLSTEQSLEIYRLASKILTLYYDMHEFRQIYPWHHAAGDFIARVEGNKIDLRLTTARQYEPYMVFQEKEGINPLIALFYFLLNLTVKMRLDKLDGLGDTVWAEDFCLEASVKGFLDGLRLKKELNDYFSSELEFVNILKSFCMEDLKIAYGPLIDIYRGTGDYPVITANLNRHVGALYTILQNYPS